MFSSGGLSLYSIVYSRRDLEVNASVLVSNCTFQGEGAYLSVQDYSYSWFEKASFQPDSRIRGNRFSGEGTRLICHRHLIDWILEDNILEDGSTFYALYELNFRWPEHVSSRDLNYEIFVDPAIIGVSEDVLGREWERWDPIFVEGSTDPISIVDPEPVPIAIKGDYSSVGLSSGWWTMGFSSLDPTDASVVIEVPEWERVSDLISSHYGDAWNQGS